MTHCRPVSTPGTFHRLLKYLKPHRVAVLGAILLSGLAALATSAYAYLIGPLLRALLLGGGVSLGPWNATAEALAWQIPALLVAVASVKAFSQFFQNGLMLQTAFRVMRRIRRDLYEKLLSLPPSFYHRKHSGDLLTRMTQDVAQLEFAVSGALASLVRDFLQILALISVCIQLDARLFAFMFLVMPMTLFPLLRFAKSLKKVARKTQASVGQLTEAASELWNNLAVVQAYNAQKAMISRFENQQEAYLQLMKKSLFIRGAITPTLEFMGILGAAMWIVYGAKAVRSEPELASRLLTFLASALLIYRPLKNISQTLSQWSQASSSAERIFEVLDADSPKETGIQAKPLQKAIEFVDVSATYDGQNPVLKRVMLTAPLGKKMGLVGASGAGKTTLFSTLLGFLPTSSGSILWDGVPLSSFSPSSIRSHIAWVPQEPILFSGTIRDNLLFACPGATEAQLWDALRRSHAEHFVKERPLQLDAEVGERGSLLSGGQRQRLAIARAFLKQPSVLLLDEPTSALDAESEKEVQAGLQELLKGRTTFIIAHRLSTVRDADVVWVMDKGEVIEQGTHDRLMALKGSYFSLVEAGLFQEKENAA